jgi:hypothetical protein
MLGTLKKKVRNLSPQKSSPQTFSAGSRDHVTPEEERGNGTVVGTTTQMKRWRGCGRAPFSPIHNYEYVIIVGI